MIVIISLRVRFLKEMKFKTKEWILTHKEIIFDSNNSFFMVVVIRQYKKFITLFSLPFIHVVYPLKNL